MRRRMAFGLEALLEHRRLLEEAALAGLAVCRRGHVEATQKLAWLRASEPRGGCDAPGVGRLVSAGDLAIVDRHIRLLDRACALQTRAVTERQADVESARDAVFAARRARKIIETLRDRRLAAFRAAENRAEQTELDETNLLRRTRTSGIQGT